MPEYRNAGEKVSPASLVLPTVCCVSPASVFRHQRQSGTAGHGLFRLCPAMKLTMLTYGHLLFSSKLSKKDEKKFLFPVRHEHTAFRL
jgi:hypothetical protein